MAKKRRKRKKISDAEFQTMVLLYDTELTQYKRRHYEVLAELETFIDSIPLDYRREMSKRGHGKVYADIEKMLKEVKPKHKLVMFRKPEEPDDFDEIEEDFERMYNDNEDWDEIDNDGEEGEDDGPCPAD